METNRNMMETMRNDNRRTNIPRCFMTARGKMMETLTMMTKYFPSKNHSLRQPGKQVRQHQNTENWDNNMNQSSGTFLTRCFPVFRGKPE